MIEVMAPITDTWKRDAQLLATVRASVFPGSNDAEMALFLHDCARHGVHPLDRLIHPQVRTDKQGRRRYVAVTGIDLMRSRAGDTGDHAGTEDAVFEREAGNEFPVSARVTVYKIVHGLRCEFTATARWDEYFPAPPMNSMWLKMPFGQLAKCAEALALRKAFPRSLAGVYESSEMDQAGEAPAYIPSGKGAPLSAQLRQILNTPAATPAGDAPEAPRATAAPEDGQAKPAAAPSGAEVVEEPKLNVASGTGDPAERSGRLLTILHALGYVGPPAHGTARGPYMKKWGRTVLEKANLVRGVLKKPALASLRQLDAAETDELIAYYEQKYPKEIRVAAGGNPLKPPQPFISDDEPEDTMSDGDAPPPAQHEYHPCEFPGCGEGSDGYIQGFGYRCGNHIPPKEAKPTETEIIASDASGESLMALAEQCKRPNSPRQFYQRFGAAQRAAFIDGEILTAIGSAKNGAPLSKWFDQMTDADRAAITGHLLKLRSAK